LWVKGEIFRNLDDAVVSARGELDRANQPSLFDRLEWFRRTLQYCAPPGQPLIIRARSEGSDCWLFLIVQRGHAVALASWYSLVFHPIFTGAPDERSQHAMLVAIARRLKKHAATITLAPMPEADATRLVRAFNRARWMATQHPTTVNWSVVTDGMSFAEYWAARPGELRSTVKRKATKFSVETQVFNQFDGVAWSSYEQVYAASWKPDEGSTKFLRDTALSEGKAGALRLGIATMNGVAVAAQLWTVENGRAIIHKLAHLESAAEASPGSILTAAMFEHVIDRDHVKIVDFGTGDDRYKADWMDMRVPLMTVQLFNPLKPAGLTGAIREGARMLVGRRPSV
jgi:hypothetical protein